MPKTYVLVDLQNQQPEPASIASWIDEDGEAWLFFGEHELSLLPHYFEIGPQVSVVPISRPGKNSLDFHLILYLGYLIAKSKQPARFVVVANDRDYDAAIEHARSQGIQVERIGPLPSSPRTLSKHSPRAESRAGSIGATSPRAGRSHRRPAIVVYAGVLRDLRSNPPRNLIALRNRIRSRLGEDPTSSVEAIIAHLLTMDVVEIQGETVRYHLD